MNKEEIKEKIEEITNLIIDTQSIIDVTKESCINNEYYNQETVLIMQVKIYQKFMN